MKWDEIPKFISTQNCYHVNLGISSYVKWIKEEENGLGLQMNPDFQRGHVWTQEQQERYIEFLLSGGHTGKDFYFNCKKGTYNNETSEDLYVCVDGLQRSNAIQKFINNEIKAFGQYYKDFERTLRATEYTITIWVNDLPDKYDILRWYIQFNEGGTPHSKEEIERIKSMIKN